VPEVEPDVPRDVHEADAAEAGRRQLGPRALHDRRFAARIDTKERRELLRLLDKLVT